MQSRRTLFLGICKFIVNLQLIRHIFLDNLVLKIIIVNRLIINLLTIFVEVINVSEIPAEKLKETVALFMRTDRMRRSVFERQASDRFGIHQKQHITLMHLSRNEDISQKQLAEHFKVSPAAVAVSLKKLESKGLISRQCSSDDSRRNALKITEKGRAMVNETHKIFTAIDRAMFDGLNEDEIEVFINCLEKIQDNLKRIDTPLSENGEN